MCNRCENFPYKNVKIVTKNKNLNFKLSWNFFWYFLGIFKLFKFFSFAILINIASFSRASSILHIFQFRLLINEWERMVATKEKISSPFSNSMSHIIAYQAILLSAAVTLIIEFFRCVDIGKYTMDGNSNRTCIRSRWTGKKPHCLGLNQENDYASNWSFWWLQYFFKYLNLQWKSHQQFCWDIKMDPSLKATMEN